MSNALKDRGADRSGTKRDIKENMVLWSAVLVLLLLHVFMFIYFTDVVKLFKGGTAGAMQRTVEHSADQ